MTIAAGIVSILLGLGFGIPGILGLRHFAEHGEVWAFMGFPAYGNGPFESVGMQTSVLLLAAFLVVCGVEVAVGALLLAGQRPEAWLALGLLPFELVFWIGFVLPFGPDSRPGAHRPCRHGADQRTDLRSRLRTYSDR